MAVVCLVLLALWTVHWWAWKGSLDAPTKKDDLPLRVEAPLIRQDCEAQEIPCIDDCSFLCLDSASECVGGTCRPKTSGGGPIRCNPVHGLRVLVQDPVPTWTCLCTDARFYGGDACDRLNPDVCENGRFVYTSRSRYACVCDHPFELIQIDWKPHCVDKKLMGFYDEATMNRKLLRNG